MHSEKILIFEPEGSRLRKAGAGVYSNSLIAIRRCAAQRAWRLRQGIAQRTLRRRLGGGV